jgi:hypothetical protein
VQISFCLTSGFHWRVEIRLNNEPTICSSLRSKWKRIGKRLRLIGFEKGERLHVAFGEQVSKVFEQGEQMDDGRIDQLFVTQTLQGVRVELMFDELMGRKCRREELKRFEPRGAREVSYTLNVERRKRR